MDKIALDAWCGPCLIDYLKREGPTSFVLARPMDEAGMLCDHCPDRSNPALADLWAYVGSDD